MNKHPATETRHWNLTFEAGSARVTDVLEEYLCALERGERPDCEQLIAAHPELAEELTASLAKLEALHNAAVGLQDSKEPAVTAQLSLNPTPQRLGDFVIEREIARGGMGIVYEAEQVSLRRRAALKTLPLSSLEFRAGVRIQIWCNLRYTSCLSRRMNRGGFCRTILDT